MKWIILIVCLSVSGILFGQEQTDHFSLRNYNSSELIKIGSDRVSTNVISAYGKLQSQIQTGTSGRYFFQGQEYDEVLGIYFFPARLYDANTLRFFQVDPKSQYHSSYLFVGADPVNIIDRNGEQGKPLFLYSEDHDLPGGLSEDIKSLKEAYPDAHFVPLSDVVNGDVMPLPEWNGNVFIDTHTGDAADAQLEVERGKNPYDFKTEDLVEDVLDDGSTRAGVSGDYLGERLRELANEKNVELKNVFVGGCEGSTAAERISEGFASSEAGPAKGLKARFAGAKKGRLLLYEGKGEYYDDGIRVLNPSNRIHFVPTDKNISPKITTNENGEKFFAGFERPDPTTGVVQDIPSVDRQGILDLTEMRIPPNVASEIDVFERVY